MRMPGGCSSFSEAQRSMLNCSESKSGRRSSSRTRILQHRRTRIASGVGHRSSLSQTRKIPLTRIVSGGNLKRTVVVMTVSALQQCTGEDQPKKYLCCGDQIMLSGIIFVLGYGTYFFELAGFSTDNAFNLGVGVTAVGVMSTISFM